MIQNITDCLSSNLCALTFYIEDKDFHICTIGDKNYPMSDKLKVDDGLKKKIYPLRII